MGFVSVDNMMHEILNDISQLQLARSPTLVLPFSRGDWTRTQTSKAQTSVGTRQSMILKPSEWSTFDTGEQ